MAKEFKLNLTDAVARAICTQPDLEFHVVTEASSDTQIKRMWELKIPNARAAIAVFCRYLREPSEELLIHLCGPGYKDCEEAERNLLRALATHISEESK